MNISSATFDRSAPDLDSCPDESLPEFAFIGRSNVGKSSLLNMLSGKPDLARVSTTPGFTKLINIFTMNRCWRLVDLPGYGFAHGARKHRARFNEAVVDYLEHRTNLCLVFVLIESGLAPQEIDLEFVAWLVRHAVPDYRERIFYISGPQAMVKSVRRKLQRMGVRRSRIRVDFFPGFA